MKEEKGSLEIGDLSWGVHACHNKPVDIQDAHLLTCRNIQDTHLLTCRNKHSLATTSNHFLRLAVFLACRGKCALYAASFAALCLSGRAFINKLYILCLEFSVSEMMRSL